MKGQVNFEFIISVMVFLSVMSFITIQIINGVSVLRRELSVEDMKSSAFQVSNVIAFDEGYPENWNAGNVLRIGLSSGFYSLDDGKINSLKELCESENGYKKFVSLIGLEFSKDVYLNISKLSGETLAICSPKVESRVRNIVQADRTFFSGGYGIVKLNIKVIL
ncbi:MAG: hypothetical protein HYW27_01080 [Candidatus Aenigmarchaeota archaeon]|nr:hypothetical protein [Candidatus Aenigmarchaeota archaeon]